MIVKLLLTLLIVTAGWLLAHRVLPFLFVRIGRLLGFSMKLNPLTERRIRRFKAIKRGYWCFIIVTTAFTLSLFLELLMNHKALMIRNEDRMMFPAVAEWLNGFLPFGRLNDTARARDFGLLGDGEVPYRKLARWVGDPEELERDAARIEEGIRKDEKRFRGNLTRIFTQRGESYDPNSPLPDFKLDEYERKQKEAAALRALRPKISSGDVGILMPLHPFSPREQLLSFEGTHPLPAFGKGVPILGTDFEGKEILSQLCYGFRVSFSFAILVAVIGFTIGIAVGAIMGYFGGWVDIFIQRFIEVWSSIPFLFTMMIIASVSEAGFVTLVVMLVVLRSWLGITYTIRGEFYREKARDYVQAARAIGVRSGKIMARHIFPNALVPVVTFMPFAVVAYIFSLVSLDFLGFGLPPEVPSWGRLLKVGSENIANHPELIYFPILAVAVTLFCVVMVGEAVREAFDPKTYSRLR
jgi:microcin C transport system permease protein